MARVLVVASLPSHCVVCGGDRRVLIVRGYSPTGARTGQTTPCPHCQGSLPIAHLPMRTDSPKDVA